MRTSLLLPALAIAAGLLPGLTAQAAPVAVAPHVHLMATRDAARRDPANEVGVNTPCFLTASAGCAPVPLTYAVPVWQSGRIANGTGPAVEVTSTNYLIYWEPSGSVVSSTYHSLVDRFFDDVGGSTLYGVATQYYQTSGGSVSSCTGHATTTTCTFIQNSSVRGASWVDTGAFPSSYSSTGVITDGDIRNEVTHAMSVNGWTAGMGKNFFVFLPRGVTECMDSSTCSFSNYCAYHSYFNSGSTPVIYGAMPYVDTNRSSCGYQSADFGLRTSAPTGPNGDIAADEEISTASHELMEIVTDPTLDAWYDPTGYEIGDKCAYTYGPIEPNGTRPTSNVTHNGHSYLVQLEWDNAGAGCAS